MMRASDAANAGAATWSDPAALIRVQRRTLGVLVVGQVLGGLSLGSSLALGALLAEAVSGDAALSGMAATLSTLGAAVVAVPLAALAGRRGRRIALSLGSATAAVGAALAIVAAVVGSFPLLLVAFAMIGSGAAVGLQSRFAASDLADPRHRGRDLSVVVWSTVVGAVAGPNLVGPGEALGDAFGLPPLSGVFLFALAAQIAAAVLYFAGLRPDPLLLRDRLALSAAEAPAGSPVAEERTDRMLVAFAFVALGLSHATMVSVMAMTPVHLMQSGATIQIVGIVISLHIAGMFLFSPLFGIMADRFGRVPTVLAGQVLLVAAVATTGFGADAGGSVTVGLVLLGVGWSASTVAASALLTDAVATPARTRVQGRADLVMNLAGAVGGAGAGPVLVLLGFAGMSFAASGLVVVVLIAAAVVITRRPGVLRAGPA